MKRTAFLQRTLIIAWVACLAGGCGRVARIEVKPENPLLTGKGDTIKLQATVLDKSGKKLPDVKVRFKSMTPTMATVDHLGNVSAVTSGEATILVRAGKISKEIQIQVQIPKKIVIKPFTRMLMVGVSKAYKATVIDDRGQAMITGEGVRWSTSDPTVVSVDKYGNIKTVKEGAATLTALAAGIKGTALITVKHEELDKEGTLDNRER